MIIAIESVVLCVLFTLAILVMVRNPIKQLYNYPPNIQERVKSLDAYKNQIPTQKNKIAAKCVASVLFIVIIALILRFVNGYTTFLPAFGYGFLLWTIVNLYDLIVLDIIWFCHDPRFVFKGTEDMVEDYHDYKMTTLHPHKRENRNCKTKSPQCKEKSTHSSVIEMWI